jgi:hypothetical protein
MNEHFNNMSHLTTHILIQNYQMYFSESHMDVSMTLLSSCGDNERPTGLNIQITFTPSCCT